ncbi:NUDIX domain-containing protein [Streptomyces sp. NPDC008001]|uniref:NUDIX hydrolase n=1 Tax=Streptomyces sp. NPDC008001 TaxID=3364804 RepID=UPI0036E98DB8
MLLHTSWSDQWQPPGGGHDEGEDLWQTAVRETYEETGRARPRWSSPTNTMPGACSPSRSGHRWCIRNGPGKSGQDPSAPGHPQRARWPRRAGGPVGRPGGDTASARSTRGLRGTGGSCRIRKATCSARRRPGRACPLRRRATTPETSEPGGRQYGPEAGNSCATDRRHLGAAALRRGLTGAEHSPQQVAPPVDYGLSSSARAPRPC